MDTKQFLTELFRAAVTAADPMQTLASALPEKPNKRILVIGAGKASARMAEAVEAHWGPCEGLVITRYGYARPCEGIEIVEAAHPVPDLAGLKATNRILELVKSADENTYILALISGGASALLTSPAGTITLSEKQKLNGDLLASGAPITQMNIVRKHLSNVKGGQLAAASYPAELLSLMISDIPGDDPAFIGSGPTVGDNSTVHDARAILERYEIEIPSSVEAALSKPSGVVKTSDTRHSKTTNLIYAAPSQSLAAAKQVAEQAGCEVLILGDDLEGEARELAIEQIKFAKDVAVKPMTRPVLILSGGEVTVTKRGSGIGGPNAEFTLAAAIAADGHPQIHVLACDTDGVDGAAEVAGAYAGPETLEKARSAGISAEQALNNNDAHSFFATIQSQIITGPTLTNVNDFRAILVMPKEA